MLAQHAADPDSRRLTLSKDDVAFLKGLYASAALYADLWLQVLLDDLAARNMLETTTIVVVSDHGEGLLDHGYFNHRDSLHDAATQVPFIVWRPDAAERGVRQREVTRLLDVSPTILGLAGVGAPDSMQGVDLTPCLDGGDCNTPGTAYSEAVLEMTSVTDGVMRLTVTGAPAHTQAMTTRIKKPAPAYASVWDAGGAPGTEQPMSVLELDPVLLKRLQDGALQARQAGGAE